MDALVQPNQTRHGTDKGGWSSRRDQFKKSLTESSDVITFLSNKQHQEQSSDQHRSFLRITDLEPRRAAEENKHAHLFNINENGAAN